MMSCSGGLRGEKFGKSAELVEKKGAVASEEEEDDDDDGNDGIRGCTS